MEGLQNDEDFHSFMTRAQFEEMSEPLLERLRQTVRRAVEQSNRTLVRVSL